MNKKQLMIVWGIAVLIGLLFAAGILSRRYSIAELFGMLIILSMPILIIGGLLMYTFKKK